MLIVPDRCPILARSRLAFLSLSFAFALSSSFAFCTDCPLPAFRPSTRSLYLRPTFTCLCWQMGCAARRVRQECGGCGRLRRGRSFRRHRIHPFWASAAVRPGQPRRCGDICGGSGGKAGVRLRRRPDDDVVHELRKPILVLRSGTKRLPSVTDSAMGSWPETVALTPRAPIRRQLLSFHGVAHARSYPPPR